jgi:hypothetical protein
MTRFILRVPLDRGTLYFCSTKCANDQDFTTDDGEWLKPEEVHPHYRCVNCDKMLGGTMRLGGPRTARI